MLWVSCSWCWLLRVRCRWWGLWLSQCPVCNIMSTVPVHVRISTIRRRCLGFPNGCLILRSMISIRWIHGLVERRSGCYSCGVSVLGHITIRTLWLYGCVQYAIRLLLAIYLVWGRSTCVAAMAEWFDGLYGNTIRYGSGQRGFESDMPPRLGVSWVMVVVVVRVARWPARWVAAVLNLLKHIHKWLSFVIKKGWII